MHFRFAFHRGWFAITDGALAALKGQDSAPSWLREVRE